MTKARDLASSGVTLTSTTTTADAALARAGGTMTGDLAMGTNLVDGVDVSARDAVLTSTTTLASAALPKSGGAMTGAITTNSTFDGVDIATRDAVLSSTTTTATNALNNANNALPKEGGAMTGPITTNSTFDGVDVGSRDSVLTSTTTTANAALPKTGGAMTGAITTNSTFDGVDIATRDAVLTSTTTVANAALPKAGGDVTGLLKLSSIDPILRFNDTNGGTDTKNFEMRYVGTSSPDIDGLYFRTANDALNSYSDKMVILGSGNVGIGVAAPQKSLDVEGSIRSKITGGATSAEIDITSGGTWRLRSNPTTGTNDYGFDIVKGSAGTDVKMSISSSGNVGIATSSPSVELSIAGSDPQLVLWEGADGASSSKVQLGTGTAQGFINVHKGDGTRTVQINSDGDSYFNGGNVGIGVVPEPTWSSNNTALQIGDAGVLFASTNDSFVGLAANAYFDSTNSRYEYINTDFATLYQQLDGTHVWSTAASGSADAAITWSESIRITSSGNLLVGKNASSNTTVGIDLVGTQGQINSVITNAGGAQQNIFLNRQDADGNFILFRKANASVGSIGVNSSAYTYITNPQYGGGGVSFGTNSALIPVSNTGAFAGSAKDIGASSVPFRDLYLSGGVRFDATGEFLDDYEEGTWTPYLARWTGGNISATYTAQNGRYTKIGRMVTLSFDITVSSISSQGSSIAYISGAPFNNPSSQDYDYAGTFGIRTCIPEATIATSCIKHSTNTAIIIRQNNDFDQNIDDNWQSGIMRGSITYEHG